MIETFKNAWKVPEIRKKLQFVFFAIVVFRFAHAIYVPFINTSLLAAQFAQYSTNLLGYFNVLSGGGLQTASILALSIYPYINSSIIMQLLQVAIPALERMAKEGGEAGRKKIEMITRLLALVLSAIMGAGYLLMLSNMEGVVTATGAWPSIVIVLTFMAGAMFTMWLGEQITQKGIGNGTSMIIFIGIVGRLPSTVQTLINGFKSTVDEAGVAVPPSMNWWKLLIVVGISLAIIVFVVYITNAERRIPVQYAKRVVGRKQYGGQSTHLPMKVNMSGVMPVIFASTLATVPATIASFLPPKDTEGFLYKLVNDWFTQSSPAYIIVYTVLIFVFAYFYSTIQFNPIEVSNNLKKNGGFIPGFRPGKPTSDFIARVLNKITMMGAIFLALIAAAPLILSNIPGLGDLAIGGTSVLIMVSVALETVKALEGQLLMRHYKGFLE